MGTWLDAPAIARLQGEWNRDANVETVLATLKEEYGLSKTQSTAVLALLSRGDLQDAKGQVQDSATWSSVRSRDGSFADALLEIAEDEIG